MAKDPRGQDVLQRIRNQGPEPVYLFYGREGWFADRAISLLKRAIFGPEIDTINFDLFAGREAKAKALETACQTLPMFAERRLVVLRQAGAIPDKEWKGFLPYFNEPADTTTLFVDWGPKKPDGRSKWVKEIKKQGAVADCSPLYDNEVPSFLRHLCRQREVDMRPDAANALAHVVGQNLHGLEDAVERLSIFVDAGNPITLDDVETVIADTRSHEIWDLTDAVSAKALPKALKILQRVRDQGTVAPALIASLHRTIRQLWQARELGHLDRQALARKLGLHPYVAGKVQQAARRFSDDALAKAVIGIAAAEVQTRSGAMSGPQTEWIVLEGLVTRLCA